MYVLSVAILSLCKAAAAAIREATIKNDVCGKNRGKIENVSSVSFVLEYSEAHIRAAFTQNCEQAVFSPHFFLCLSSLLESSGFAQSLLIVTPVRRSQVEVY